MLGLKKKINTDFKLSILLVGVGVGEIETISDTLSFSFDSITSKALKDFEQEFVSSIKSDFILVDADTDLERALDLSSNLRAQKHFDHVPMIALMTPQDSEARMKAYNAGFDDCIHKPFRPLELLARVEAKLRWVKKAPDAYEVIRCGNLELSKPSFEVRINNRSVRLTSLEVKLLDYFINNKSKVLSRQEILTSVWNSTVVLDRTVDSHIVTLRKKLEGSDHSVKTVFGAGYIFEWDQKSMVAQKNA